MNGRVKLRLALFGPGDRWRWERILRQCRIRDELELPSTDLRVGNMQRRWKERTATVGLRESMTRGVSGVGACFLRGLRALKTEV